MTRTPGDRPVILVVAGSDSSGGAGIAADIRTAAALGATARIAVTAVTVQTARGVGGIHRVPPALLREQIAAALDDGQVGAVKVGMLGADSAVEAVADALQGVAHALPIVLDPVLASTSGGLLLDAAGIRSLIDHLLPLAALVTPNRPELDHLASRIEASRPQSIEWRAALLLAAGAKAVLVKGGHADGPLADDLLFSGDRASPARFSAPRHAVGLRGTGCMLSTAIAVHLAAGHDMEEACRRAKAHLSGLFAGETERRAGRAAPVQIASNIRT